MGQIGGRQISAQTQRTTTATRRARSVRRPLVFVALFSAAMIGAVLNSLPLVGLVGAVAALVNAHSRAKRRAAKAALLATIAALAWVPVIGLIGADARLAYCAPVVGGSVSLIAHLRDRTRRRRRRTSSVFEAPPGEELHRPPPRFPPPPDSDRSKNGSDR